MILFVILYVLYTVQYRSESSPEIMSQKLKNLRFSENQSYVGSKSRRFNYNVLDTDQKQYSEALHNNRACHDWSIMQRCTVHVQYVMIGALCNGVQYMCSMSGHDWSIMHRCTVHVQYVWLLPRHTAH